MMILKRDVIEAYCVLENEVNSTSDLSTHVEN